MEDVKSIEIEPKELDYWWKGAALFSAVVVATIGCLLLADKILEVWR